MKNILFAVLIALIGFTTQAQEKKSRNAKKDVEVKGNCEMCKKRIEKAAYSVAGVKSAVWHSNDQTLHLVINEEKTNALEVQKAIAKAGHDTESVKSTTEDYAKLPACCAYERE